MDEFFAEAPFFISIFMNITLAWLYRSALIEIVDLEGIIEEMQSTSAHLYRIFRDE